MKFALGLLWVLTLAGALLKNSPLSEFRLMLPAGEPLSFANFILTWGGHALALVALGLWLGALYGWGAPVLSWIGRVRLPAGTRPIAALGAGFALLGFALMGLGLAGLLFPGLALVSCAAPLLRMRCGWPRPPTLSAILPPAGERAWLVALAAPALVVLPALFAPESSWDAIVYHLRFPAFYLMEHKLFFIQESPFGGFPCLTEMHYLIGLPFFKFGGLAKLQHAACWFLTARLLYVCVRPVSAAAGYASALLWLGLPLGMHLAGTAYIDLASAWFFTLAAVCLSGNGSARWVLAGVFAGSAFATKYTGGFAVVGLVAVAASVKSRRAALGAILAALVPVLLWSARNWLVARNPVYLFFPRIFGGVSSPALEFWLANPPALSAGPVESLARLVRAALGDDGGVGVTAGPLWLAVLAPALLAARVSRLARYAGGAFLCWLVLPLNVRFLLPVLPSAFLAIAPSWRVAHVRAIAFAALAVLGPLGLAHGMRSSFALFDPLPPALGLRSAAGHLSLGLPPQPEYWQGALAVNRALPERARLLFLGGIKSFGYRRRASVAHQRQDPVPLLRFLREAGGSSRLSVRLRQAGFTHLVYLPRSLRSFPARPDLALGDTDARILVEWLTERTTFVFREGELLVYALGERAAARALGRVPLLEESAISSLNDSTGRAAPRAVRQLERLAPQSSSRALAEAVGFLLRNPGYPGAALAPIRRALRDPEVSVLAWRAHGFVMWREGRIKEALASYERAVAWDPQAPELRREVADFLAAIGRPEEAAAHLAAAARHER